MIRKASYRGVPAWFDLETEELVGINWLCDRLIDLNLWWDIEVLGIEEIPIKIYFEPGDEDFE